MKKSYLKELVIEGLSQAQIAKRADCSVSTVKRYLKLYELKTIYLRAPSPGLIEKAHLKGLVAEGLTQPQIAKRCSCSRNAIRYWLKKYGLKTQVPDPLIHKCTCGETDPTKFYGRCKTRCKACQNIENVKRVRTYKEEAICTLGGKCVRCGYDKCIAAFDFHHKDLTEKDPDFAKMKNWSFERKKSEVEKCELLCANCHREEHFTPL